MDNCIFCKIANKEIPVEMIFENENFFSIFDTSPRVKGHSLVISKKHFEDILNLPKELGNDLLDCIKQTGKKLMKEFNATGFNVLNNCKESAGMLVNHIHFHIIPRKKNDGLRINGLDN